MNLNNIQLSRKCMAILLVMTYEYIQYKLFPWKTAAIFMKVNTNMASLPEKKYKHVLSYQHTSTDY